MDPQSSALHARARAFVAAFEAGACSPEPFDALACDLARYQAKHIQGFARLCLAQGLDPNALASAAEIPAVPTEAFKVTRVATFEPAEAAATFRTSGTTVGTRGEHAMRDVATYEAAAVAFGRFWLARDLEARAPVIVLGPAPAQAVDSSLVHMCAAFVGAFGVPSAPASTYLIDADGVLDLARFDERVAGALARNQPMLILGTSFAFVHFVDGLGKDTFHLPRGSRVMQTGGYKGRSREVPAEVLRADLARVFGLDVRSIVAEYGMTELSSQFYERTLFDAAAPLGVYAEPPWARVVPVDPATLAPVGDGEVGIAKIIDLMNVDSAVAVLTQDRVRRAAEGFELLGRAPGAPARGCSIAIDEDPRARRPMITRSFAERLTDVRRLQQAARAAIEDRAKLVRAIVASTGLSAEGVELALSRQLELEASDADLARLIERAGDASRVAVVLSANVFVGALRALVLARAASKDVVVRPSRRDPAFAHALVGAAVAAGDRGLRLDDSLDIASVEEGEIHVYGRDATIADVRAKARMGVCVRGHGSGMGVVWISSAAELAEAARGLAADVVVFDQRGCLSPRIALVHGDQARALALADALHAELERQGSIVPRGEVPADERAAAGRYIATMTYACHALVGRQHAIGVGAPGAPLVLPPPYRHVHVAACGSLEVAGNLLAPLARGVVTVGSDDVAAARALVSSGVRLAALGAMQRPPLDGPVDLRDR